jgi:hypothetical protein
LSVGPGREIAASETQRTAVLRASKAVSWARRGFEVGTKRATTFSSSITVEKEGNTNYYTPAIPQEKALRETIDRCLDEVVGPEPENRQLLKKILRG